jgi:hypothetical protein
MRPYENQLQPTNLEVVKNIEKFIVSLTLPNKKKESTLMLFLGKEIKIHIEIEK